MSERFHDGGETAQGHRPTLRDCLYHVHHGEQCSKIPGMHALSSPSRLAHAPELLVGKSVHKYYYAWLFSVTKGLRSASTFISAFESSPVHCLKSLPSGKRR